MKNENIFSGTKKRRKKMKKKTIGEGKYLFAEEKKNRERELKRNLEKENIYF